MLFQNALKKLRRAFNDPMSGHTEVSHNYDEITDDVAFHQRAVPVLTTATSVGTAVTRALASSPTVNSVGGTHLKL